ncbi:MAG TPA: hypothetical protein VF310_16470, partial [Vicinamibacteria bacterium]
MTLGPTRRAVLLLAAGFPLALLPALVAAPLWPAWAALLAGTAAATNEAATPIDAAPTPAALPADCLGPRHACRV